MDHEQTGAGQRDGCLRGASRCPEDLTRAIADQADEAPHRKSGRGHHRRMLFMMSEIANGWGYYPTSVSGKIVWTEVNT